MRVWLVTIFMLAVALSPVVPESSELNDSAVMYKQSNSIQSSISQSSGWISGGEELTITGSGFSELAYSNTTYDGINHQWNKTTVDFADQAGHENAIAVDSNGNVHIVHANGGNYELKHAIFDGTSWNSKKIKNCETSYCIRTHMVIDDNDELHAAYYANGDYLIYMHYDGVGWNSTTVTSNVKYGEVGIAVDSNNNPHISYTASGMYCGSGIRLASFDGSSWTTQSVESGTNIGCESSIVIDENDHINIAYQFRDESKLKFATNRSGTWDRYAADPSPTPSAMYPGYFSSLAVDSTGKFHIAHHDNKNNDLRYATGIPNTPWSVGIVDASGNTGRSPSIAIDVADNPHIVYHTWSGFDLKYAKLTPENPNWQVSTLATGGDMGASNSLFIDDNGLMHVAYSDETNNVLKYASKPTGVSITKEVSIKFGQHGSVTGTVVDDNTIVVTTPTISTASIVNLSIIDKDGVEHQLSSSFEFIDQYDLDSDGILNAEDDCPEVAGNSTEDATGCPDDDGDGFSNNGDAFPNDPTEWLDSDGDGVGDNTDAFPNDATETQDSDSDGVGDNSDAFPFNAFEQMDTDGDGVGDNSDQFPNDATETTDSDGDGVGDNADVFPMNAFEALDSDGDGVGDNSDAFPNDASETMDSDGDGVGDNSDVFPNDATESLDSDGDGIGDSKDQCPNSLENETIDENGCSVQIDTDGDGIFDADDDCPETNASILDLNGDGCLDDADEDGIIDSLDDCPSTQFGENTSANGCSDRQLMLLDSDSDGVSDYSDNCPGTPEDTLVDDLGCEVEATNEDENEDEEDNSFIESLLAGEAGTVTTTFGISAILLALLTLLQTNAAAAILPDAFRWVQVLRRNSKLSKEEVNELTYLQSIVQAYYNNPAELAEELNQLKGDLTARYTNNDIKKQTREKLFTLIDDLLSSAPDELYRIAHNDAYFGLAGTIDSEDRANLLNEKLAMDDGDGMNTSSPVGPAITEVGEVKDDGYEWLEWPKGSGQWYYRIGYSNSQWNKWE